MSGMGRLRLVACATAAIALSAGMTSPSAGARTRSRHALPACTDNWTNPAGGSWFDASDWTLAGSSTHQVPGATDVACITMNGTYTVTIQGGGAVADTLQLGGGGGTQTLALSADNACADNTGGADFEAYDHASASVAASVSPHGAIQLTQDSSTCPASPPNNYDVFRVDNGALANAGSIESDSGGVAASQVTARVIAGSVTNSGQVVVTTGSEYVQPGSQPVTFDNAGTVGIANGVVLDVPPQNDATILDDTGGTISNGAGTGYLYVDHGNNTYEQGAGTTSPSGAVPANPAVIVNGATITYPGAGAASIVARGGPTLTGDIPSGENLELQCTNGTSADMHTPSFTNAGYLTLASTPTCGSGNVVLSVDTGVGWGTGTLTNVGVIQGDGTLSGAVQNTTGDVVPGLPPAPGQLVAGSYDQGSGGTLEAVIDGTSAVSGFSQLKVTGTAMLQGTIAVLTGSGFTPAVGESFQVVAAGTRNGAFGSLTGQLPASSGLAYSTVYGAGTASVVVGSTPTGGGGGGGGGGGHPQPPKCTITLVSHKPITRHVGHGRHRHTSTILHAKAHCNQAASTKLRVTVTVALPAEGKHHKHKTRTFTLAPLRAPVPAGRSHQFTLTLPGAVVGALDRHETARVNLILTATNANGTSTARSGTVPISR